MYWINLFIAVDRLVNVIAKGHINATVSARVGFFANLARIEGGGSRGLYWLALEKLINFAFLPVDGPNHCYRAMREEKYSEYSKGNDWARAWLAPIVIIFCGIFSVAIRVVVLIVPQWRYKAPPRELE